MIKIKPCVYHLILWKLNSEMEPPVESVLALSFVNQSKLITNLMELWLTSPFVSTAKPWNNILDKELTKVAVNLKHVLWPVPM